MEVAGQVVADQLRQGAGHLDPGGPPPTRTMVRRTRVGRPARPASACSNVRQDVVAQPHGVGEGLERIGVLLDAGDAEVAGRRAGGQDQVVVGDGRLAVDLDQSVVQVAHPTPCRAGPRCSGSARVDGPDGVGDVVGAQAGGGHLVEEGPEPVVVVPVDDGDVDRSLGQAQGGVEPPEAAADDDDMGANGHGTRCTRRRGTANRYARRTSVRWYPGTCRVAEAQAEWTQACWWFGAPASTTSATSRWTCPATG